MATGDSSPELPGTLEKSNHPTPKHRAQHLKWEPSFENLNYLESPMRQTRPLQAHLCHSLLQVLAALWYLQGRKKRTAGVNPDLKTQILQYAKCRDSKIHFGIGPKNTLQSSMEKSNCFWSRNAGGICYFQSQESLRMFLFSPWVVFRDEGNHQTWKVQTKLRLSTQYQE